MSGLELTGVNVYYGRTHAVKDVSLELPAGNILALLGASGSGKSSLLRAIAGLEKSSGRIVFDGRNVSGEPVYQRGFGLMFQDGQLFPHKNVGQNVAYGLRGRLARAQWDHRVEKLLALVGLPGMADRAVTTLSGGQAQRVALARALAPNPRLLLLDEPLSALDRALREQLSVEIRKVVHAAGTTAVYVTHDQDEAFTVADTVAVMDEGVITRIGAPANVWAKPGKRSVSSFLGYSPHMSRAEAARFGIDVPEGMVLACAPGAWQAVSAVAEGVAGSGVAVPVLESHAVRGAQQVIVAVSATASARVDLPIGAEVQSHIAVRVDPAKCALVEGD